MSGSDAGPVVRMSGIVKRFGSFAAVDGVDLAVRAQTIHAVVGENGAGKTTLMRVLYGALRPDAGSVEVDGKRVAFRNAAEGVRAGIGMVSQHYSILPELTCLENLMLGAEPGLWVDPKKAVPRAQALAERMGFTFDWHADAGGLTPAAAQKLEILKLLWRNVRIMILDEPTAMLSPADGEALFQSMRSLVADGATVLLVTHRLPEVFDYCESVTVLRGGRLVWSTSAAETDPRSLAEAIVGHALAEPDPHPPIPASARVVLAVDGLTVRGVRGDQALKAASLNLREGEIVGIAGVDGNGQRELFGAILGTLPAESGSVVLLGVDATDMPTAERIRLGLRLIPEDRHAEGVVEDWSLADNSPIGLQRLAPFAEGSRANPSVRFEMAGRIAARFDTRHGGIGKPMRSLSGGNQQRFVAARALCLDPRVVLAFQPARGLDIDATRNVYRGLRQACGESGAGALVVSFDLDELLEHCDRVVAINAGRIHTPPPGLERDRAEIGRLMVGAS
ncbi:MAG: ABC transporter ATP-binding protein [Fimbriimonadaceae bacterium]